MNTFARVLLSAGAALLGFFGVSFLFWPRWLGAQVGLGLDAPEAGIDVRAVYGGFELGVAVFLAWCARDAKLLRPGLLVAFLGVFGFAAGRAVGMFAEAAVSPLHASMFAFELAAAALALFAYRRVALPS
jgi:hypothetical protein